MDGGDVLRGTRVVVYLAPGRGPARAAWVAGRRVGNAVARNRARRLLRQAWTEIADRVRPETEAVLVARPKIAGAGSGEVVEEVLRLLERAGALAS